MKQKKRVAIAIIAMLVMLIFTACGAGDNQTGENDVTVQLSYTAGSGGSVVGNLKQNILSGSDGREVTAAADSGYRFVGWSDGKSERTRADKNVAADLAVTAQFESITYEITYKASQFGALSVDGETLSSYSIKINAGETLLPPNIVAVPDENCHFAGWSDGKQAACREAENANCDIVITARFEKDARSYAYSASAGGTISYLGESKKSLVVGTAHGDQITVTAVPDKWSVFDCWSDGEQDATRTDAISADGAVTAIFKPAAAIDIQSATDVTALKDGYEHDSIAITTGDYDLTDNDLTALVCAIKELDLSGATLASKNSSGGDILSNNLFYNTKDFIAEKLTLPRSLAEIGSKVFYGRKSLQYVYINDNVAAMGAETFKNCTALDYVRLPSNAAFTSIANQLFYGCTAITTVTYNADAESGVIMTDSITEINRNAFQACAITRAEIGKNVSGLQQNSYATASSYFPFYNLAKTDGFYTVEFSVHPENATFASVDGALYSKDKTVLYDGHSDALSLPATVVAIAPFACAYSPITSMTAANITSIGNYAFRDCKKLTTLSNLASLTTLSDYAMYSCAALTSFFAPQATTFGKYALSSCSALTYVYAPKLTALGDGAFNSCSALEYFNPDERGMNIVPAGIEKINGSTFYKCVALKNITISGSCEIATNAFSSCAALSDIVFSKTDCVIKSNAFLRCDNISKIIVPTGTVDYYSAQVGLTAFAASINGAA